MSFDLQKVLESKRKLRRDLAARPVAEKLALLDTLRQRALDTRAAKPRQNAERILQPKPVRQRKVL